MADPIVFAKCDDRSGNEALLLIYRPDRSTTKDEKQVLVRARSLDQDALSEIDRFLDVARPTLAQTLGAERHKPVEFLHVDVGGEGSSVKNGEATPERRVEV